MSGARRRPAVVWGAIALSIVLPAAAGTRADPSGTGVAEVLGLLNEARSGRGLPRLRWLESLSSAARSQAESLARQASSFPSRRPELLAELPYALADLTGLLEKAGYDAAEARATLVVGEAAPARTFGRLIGPGESFVDDFLDNDLEDLGIGTAELDGVAFYVLILARSAGELFAAAVAPLSDLPEVRRRLLAETNASRRQHERPPLRPAPCLDRAAQSYAERMLAGGFFSHVAPEGDDVEDRLRRERCRVQLAGENLAEGPMTAAAAVVSWLESVRHRRNLLDPSFTRVGFGLAYAWTEQGQRVVWVQVLAR